MATPYDEAVKCPKCEQTGDPGSTTPMEGMPGYRALPVYCRNERCTWADTMWIVQINPDGTIPDPAPPGKPRGEKMYPLGGALTAGVTDKMIEEVNRFADAMNDPYRKEV